MCKQRIRTYACGHGVYYISVQCRNVDRNYRDPSKPEYDPQKDCGTTEFAGQDLMPYCHSDQCCHRAIQNKVDQWADEIDAKHGAATENIKALERESKDLYEKHRAEIEVPNRGRERRFHNPQTRGVQDQGCGAV